MREAGPPSSSLPRPIFFLPCYSGKEKGLEGKEGGGKRKRLSSLSSSNKQRGGNQPAKKTQATQRHTTSWSHRRGREQARARKRQGTQVFLPFSFSFLLRHSPDSHLPLLPSHDAPRTIVPLLFSPSPPAPDRLTKALGIFNWIV